MLYDCLKILHVTGAALFLTGLVYSIQTWQKNKSNPSLIFSRIQSQTGMVVIPFGIFQLATGFTMMSLKQYHLSALWIWGSVTGFIIVICAWFMFIYFLLLAQQHTQTSSLRKLQFSMLIICSLSLLIMIFLMANKVD